MNRTTHLALGLGPEPARSSAGYGPSVAPWGFREAISSRGVNLCDFTTNRPPCRSAGPKAARCLRSVLGLGLVWCISACDDTAPTGWTDAARSGSAADAGAPPSTAIDARSVPDAEPARDSGSSRDHRPDSETPDSGRADAGLTIRLIAASETDPQIVDVLGLHHVAIGPESLRTDRLFLFYPGSGAAAQEYKSLIERAAVLGYHAIGLAYMNETPVNVLCRGPGEDCHGAVRREILLGVDQSPLVAIDSHNGAFARLERLLAHLDRIAPDEGWGRFLAGSQVAWARVTVSGHSQGGGHAAYTARLHAVARVVIFSGTEPAQWTEATDFATPSDRMFGFAHRLEPIYSPIVSSWRNLGLPGQPTTVDGTIPPHSLTHQLYTEHENCPGDPSSNGYYHNCHCADAWMPFLSDGTPWFQPVWDHLLAVP